MTYTQRDIEILVASGKATEIMDFDTFRKIPEGWIHLGNYEAPNEIYGYPEIKARVLEGDSGKIYIYWI